MPGTIQVSVLEFKGLSSTFLKFTLGKKEYQMFDVGIFSFPLTTLRDNLVVTVMNADGNETNLTVIQTMSIVEKVCLNDVFYLDGGGEVHLQLEFILSDEERNRIRSLREAAIKKKQSGTANVSSTQPETASSESDSVMSSAVAQQMISASSQKASSKSGYLGSKVAAKSSSLSSEDDHVDEPEKQGPALKTSSSNVRKLVGAFEKSSLVQAPVKLSSIRPEEKKVQKGGYLKDSDQKNHPEAAEPISGSRMKLSVAGNSKAARKKEEKIDSGRSYVRNVVSHATSRLNQPTPGGTDSRTSVWAKLSADMESPSAVESVGMSGRAYSFGLSTENPKSSSGTSSYIEGRSKNESAEISAQVTSIGKSKSIEYRVEEVFHFENSGMWIFPFDRKHLCITTAGKRVMNLLESHNVVPKSYHKNKNSAVSAGHADETSTSSSSSQHKNEHKKTEKHRNSRSESSSNDAFSGLIQQAIKAAIVVGFGGLVFLTRERDPRKRNKDTEDLFFEASEYTG